MNTRATALVRLAWLALLSAATTVPAAAQGRGSLTKDFDKLSAKDRSRIAAREAGEAAQDSTYQEVMRQGEALFQEKRYEDALERFQEARRLRPFNVYPKVKIEDLQALIKRQQELTPQPRQAEAPVKEAAPVERPAPREVPQAEVLAVPTPKTDEVPIAAPATPLRPVAAPQKSAPADPVHRPDRPDPGQPGERVYKEAGAVVVERVVLDDNRLVTYKKVVHPWGHTFYFKEGRSIPDWQWAERFSE
ncbi:MAG TPA: hypothetical protein PLV70_04445 [Flavobacteriales bacterium]|nr:hypothetical protein [Flavobacteriales bacterium]HRO38297.1 hypothetical protein [Flavobacteriales bacterium]HRP80456.1 hypothetical protein [Flavobacteriales bacterium]HRQ84342.1 hypothetical protein [Flavobacteriales bacterium]